MYEGISDVSEGISDESTANAAATLADIEDNEPVGNTMTPAEINALIEAHVPLVKHIVFQVAVHFPRHVEREELARAGALGLVEAAQRYSPERGIPFQRFAAPESVVPCSTLFVPPTGRLVPFVACRAGSMQWNNNSPANWAEHLVPKKPPKLSA